MIAREEELELASAAAELERETSPERMDVPGTIQTVAQQFPPSALPPDLKQAIVATAKHLWQMRAFHTARFLAALGIVFSRNPAGWWHALTHNRGAAIQQLAFQAGQQAGLLSRKQGQRRGLTDPQVRQFHRRQQARGFVPGRNRQTGTYRELESELEWAAQEMETELAAESGEAFLFTPKRKKRGRRSPQYRCPQCGAFHGAGPHVLCRDCHVKKWGPDVPWPPE